MLSMMLAVTAAHAAEETTQTPAASVKIDSADTAREETAVDSVSDSTPSQETKTVRDAPHHALPDSFKLKIPAGILFGSFQQDDGPFLLEGSIIVPSGQTLEFGPGCKVYVGGKYSTITVFGQLVAKGTEEEPVVFQSANPRPNPWDWDRIYCRSRNRSVFEHCVIRHSNYGIFVENGLASIKHGLFERNSLHGLVVKNSGVSLRYSTFRDGHVLAIYCQAGATVNAESLIVRDNITGMAFDNNASFNLTGGEIRRNTNGVALRRGASVSIVAADITRNRNGVLTTGEVAKSMREMVYSNGTDIVEVPKAQIAELLKPPADVKSIVLPKTRTAITVSPDFEPGFAALKAPRQPTASVIGNVTAGFKYYLPESDIDTAKQTRYPGEQNEKYYAGLQPETQLFLSGRRGRADVNLLADFYGNQWVKFRKNLFNLSINYADQSVVIGDFFESASETSISGRQITGLKFDNKVWEMGRGLKRLRFNLAAGETEVPKDSGDNDIDLYNEVVDSSLAVRQQITYVAATHVKPTYNSRIGVKGIIARDQTTNPFLREEITDTSGTDPIQAHSGHIDGEVTLMGGNLTLGAEVDLGDHDTLASDAEVAWYDPRIPQSVQKVFRKITDTDHFAGNVYANALVSSFDLGLSFTAVQPKFFAAGNPYLETDRRTLKFDVERQILENLGLQGGYEFEQSYASEEFDSLEGNSGPLYRNTVDLGGKYRPAENLPAFELEYTFDFQNRKEYENVQWIFATVSGGDTTYDTTTEYSDQYREVKNLIGISAKQRLKNGIDYRLRYRFLHTKDLSHYADSTTGELETGMQHQVSARVAFKFKKLLRNKLRVKLTTKNEVRDSLEGLSYRISDEVRFNIIPRKLRLTVKGEYNNKVDDEFDDDLGKREEIVTRFWSFGGRVKYSITPKLSVTVMGRYEDAEDETVGSTENYDLKVGGLNVTYLF